MIHIHLYNSIFIYFAEQSIYLDYDGVVAKIIRGDIECTNGYIHMIDKVIVKRRDITLAGSSAVFPSFMVFLTTLVVLQSLNILHINI